MQARQPFRIEARANQNDVTEIDIYGPIGPYGVSADAFAKILGDVNTSLVIVNLNSPGGDVFDGVAIYNELVRHSARVEINVMGLAASAASVIAMAGDKITMHTGAHMMIHNAWTIAVGDTQELTKTAQLLAKIDKSLAKTYAERTGNGVADIADMMNDETWFDAEEAVEAGFADEIAEDEEADAEARFDLSAFKNVPRSLVAKRKRSAKARKASAVADNAPDLSPLTAALAQLHSTVKGASLNAFKCSSA